MQSMRMLFGAVLIVFLASSAVAQIPPPPPPSAENPLSAHNKTVYRGVKALILRSAEKMPEEHYAFRPTEAVRTFGQILGHVADSQYTFCAMVLGEKNPRPKIEENKSSKAELTLALKDAFTYCDKAYDSMTDATAVEMATLFGRDTPKLGVLSVNNVHVIEHYGNLVTYLRMKDIVPPTSEPGFMPGSKK